MGDLPNIEKNRVVVEGPSGTDLIVNSDGSVNARTTSLIRTGGVESQITVGTSAVEAKAGASRYAGRSVLMITALSTGLYWGMTSGVTTSTGTPLEKGQSVTLDIGDVAVYLIATASGKTVAIVEAG